MTEVDMLVRDTLTDRADSAPNGSGLLARVHTRSRLIRRRRRVGAAGAGAAAVLLGIGGVPVVTGLLPGNGGGGEGFGGPTATKPVDPTTAPANPEPERSGAPTSPPAPEFTAVLGPPAFTTPKVPFTAPTGVIEGLAPGVPMYDGNPMIMHSPPAENGPLLMLYINARAQLEGIQGEATAVTVRGVQGKLVKPTDKVHPGVILSWAEPDGTQMWISAGNIPDEKVIAYANGLTRRDMPITVPFSFTVLPQGLELDNVGASNMVFKVPGQASSGDFINKLGFFLNADGGADAPTWPLEVNGRKALMTPQDDGSRNLQIALADGNVLAVQVPTNLKISDEDLFRMAAGVTVTSGAKAGRG